MTSAPVLVPTDFSDAAAEATAYARRVAAGTGAPLHILHAVPWPDAGPFDVPEEVSTALQEETEEVRLARAALAEAAESAGDAEATLVVPHSNVPGNEIQSYARTVGAGLIVMGMHGREARGPVLGSVAAKTVQTAPCDVLLVPHRADAPFAPFSLRAPRRVLVAVDFSPVSHRLAVFGLGLARDLGASGVDLVHVTEPLPYLLRWTDETLTDLIPAIRGRAVTALRALADDVRGEVGAAPEVSLYVERGKAARTVCQVAEVLGDDLIVVGPHAERPVFDWLLGSVAEGVARRSACPVLVARQSAEPDSSAASPVNPRSSRPTAT